MRVPSPFAAEAREECGPRFAALSRDRATRAVRCAKVDAGRPGRSVEERQVAHVRAHAIAKYFIMVGQMRDTSELEVATLLNAMCPVEYTSSQWMVPSSTLFDTG